MFSLLSIEDSLQQQRFEQVLGFPQLIYNRYDNYGLYEGLEEQYITYESSLPWPDESISILNYIYQNKKKWEVLCSVCLRKVLDMMDNNYNAMNYIAALPGPSYIYNSYLDWVKPCLVDIIEEAKKANFTKYSQEKVDKGNEIFKIYDSLEKKLAGRHRLLETYKGEIISFISDYEPLIVSKTVKEVKLSEEVLYKKRDDIISLSIIDCKVYVMDSNPNTFTNLNMPYQAIDKNEFQSKDIHPDSTFFKMVNTYFWDDYKRKKLLGKKEEKQDGNAVDDEEEVKETCSLYPDINSTDENASKKNKPNYAQNKRNLTIEVPHEKAIETLKEKEEIKDDSNYAASKDKEEYKESLNYEVINVEKKEEKVKNYPIVNVPIRQSNYIRRYVLRNETLENIKFDLKFSQNPKDLNAFFPYSISKKIHMKSSQTIITLVKRNNEEDWPNNINIETYLEFLDHSVSAVENTSSNSNINNRVIPYAPSTYPPDDYTNVDDYPSTGKKCMLCEVISPQTALKCKFCETPFENN